MSLDNIILPQSLYKSMFKNHLVDLKRKKSDESLQQKKQIEFLGGNEKKILFIASDNQNKFLSDELMSFLQGLLNACRLSMADIAFININGQQINYQLLTEQFLPAKVLIFGITANELSLPFEIPFFQIQKFQDAIYMLGPSLEELQTNKEQKKQLWLCLQKIFNIQKSK